jgi:hypothetical protein
MSKEDLPVSSSETAGKYIPLSDILRIINEADILQHSKDRLIKEFSNSKRIFDLTDEDGETILAPYSQARKIETISQIEAYLNIEKDEDSPLGNRIERAAKKLEELSREITNRNDTSSQYALPIRDAVNLVFREKNKLTEENNKLNETISAQRPEQVVEVVLRALLNITWHNLSPLEQRRIMEDLHKADIPFDRQEL